MKKLVMVSGVLVGLLLATAGFADNRYISKKSPYPVTKTLDRLENIVKSKGITVFTRVDHGAGAERVGQALHTSELLIFGNPKMGSPLMREVPIMGLELPMKALAWQDPDGQVWLSYLKPTTLERRHGLANKAIIQKMTRALDGMTSKAVSKQ